MLVKIMMMIIILWSKQEFRKKTNLSISGIEKKGSDSWDQRNRNNMLTNEPSAPFGSMLHFLNSFVLYY